MRVVTDSLKVTLLCCSIFDYFYECMYCGTKFFVYVSLRNGLLLNCFAPIHIPEPVLDSFAKFFVENDMFRGMTND